MQIIAVLAAVSMASFTAPDLTKLEQFSVWNKDPSAFGKLQFVE